MSHSTDGAKANLYLLAGFAVGVGLLITGLKKIYHYKLIRGLPTSKADSVAIGLCEVIGKATAKNNATYKTPLAQKDSVYCLTQISEKRGSGKNSHWVTILRDEYNPPFYIADDSGQVLIDPKDITKIDLREMKMNSSWQSDPPRHVIDYLKSKKLDFEGFLGINKEIMYSEQYILPDDEIYVLAKAVPGIEYKKELADEKVVLVTNDRNYVSMIARSKQENLIASLRSGAFFGIAIGALLMIGALLAIFYLNNIM